MKPTIKKPRRPTIGPSKATRPAAKEESGSAGEIIAFDLKDPADLKLICELPPSTNKLYQRRRGGGLALTTEAKKFREGVKKLVSKNLPSLMTFPVDPETIYQFDVILYFEKLENPGWFEFWKEDKFYTRDSKLKTSKGMRKEPEHRKGDLKARKGERKAKSRYKEIDYDNRIKFLQDCVVKSVGIPNDSQIFRGVQEKCEDASFPRAEVTIRVMDRSHFFTKRR
jgi:Holliday junction resolvase RusA-like endonuclease